MADLEKTIKGLRCHSEPKFGPDEYFCETCPYDERTCGLDVPNDALSLLKAQEEKKAEWTTKRTESHDGEWYCSACGYEPTVFENTPYCPACGAKMTNHDSAL